MFMHVCKLTVYSVFLLQKMPSSWLLLERFSFWFSARKLWINWSFNASIKRWYDWGCVVGWCGWGGWLNELTAFVHEPFHTKMSYYKCVKDNCYQSLLCASELNKNEQYTRSWVPKVEQFRSYLLDKAWTDGQTHTQVDMAIPVFATHSEHRFPAPSSKLCQIWLHHWRGTFYLCTAVHWHGQRPLKGSGTDKTVEAA